MPVKSNIIKFSYKTLFITVIVLTVIFMRGFVGESHAASKMKMKKVASKENIPCNLVAQSFKDTSDLTKLYQKYGTALVLLNESIYVCPCETRRLGGDTEGRTLGGGIDEGRKLAGDTEGRKLGGDTEGRTLGGSIDEGRKLAGDTEGRKLGGDAEGRTLGGGIDEDRKLAGDNEGRKLGGSIDEGRKFAGDTEGRKLGGDTEKLACYADNKCGGFKISGVNYSRIRIFNGTSIIELDSDCVN